jgi:hypothetical protein
MKTILPWLCVVGLLLALGLAYSSGQKKEAELAALREDSQQLQKLRAEQEDGKNARTTADSDELARLRKSNEDLLRLRNEVGQLRKENQQLAAQAQTAQAQAQGAQAQVQALRTNLSQTPALGQLSPAAQAAFAARYGVPPAQTPEQMQAAVCVNNLRLIDGAKQQWALEKQKPSGALLTVEDLAPYLKTNTLPACPAGGVYTLNPVGFPPMCNIPGHTLGK